MELISKKTKAIIVRRSNEMDLKNILEFHQNQIMLSLPKYLQGVLESSVGISLVAYEKETF